MLNEHLFTVQSPVFGVSTLSDLSKTTWTLFLDVSRWEYEGQRFPQ